MSLTFKSRSAFLENPEILQPHGESIAILEGFNSLHHFDKRLASVLLILEIILLFSIQIP